MNRSQVLTQSANNVRWAARQPFSRPAEASMQPCWPPCFSHPQRDPHYIVALYTSLMSLARCMLLSVMRRRLLSMLWM